MSDTDPFDGASPMHSIALVVRFLLELALLAGIAFLALQLVSAWWRWPAAVLAVLLVATLWGLFLSPKARISLPAAVAVAIEAALFLGVATGLAITGSGLAAVIGVITWCIDRIVLALHRPEP